MIPEKDVVPRVANEIRKEVLEVDFPEFSLDGGVYPLDYVGIGRPVDLVVNIDVSKEFEHLYEIGELNEWINEHSRLIPVLGIGVEYNSPHQTKVAYSEITEKSGATIPIIRLVHSEKPQKSNPISIEEQEIIFTNLTNPSSIRMDICPAISTYLMELQSSKLTEIPHVDEFLATVEPKIYHREEVARAYNNGQTGLLIILLSVFFESHYYNKLDEKFESLRENEHSGKILEDNIRFAEVLDLSRFFGVISEDEYRIVNSIRESRNEYAHNIERYHQSHLTKAEREGTVTEGIALYEEILDTKKTVLQE